MQAHWGRRPSAFVADDRIQGLARGRRCSCLRYPGPNMDAIICSESKNILTITAPTKEPHQRWRPWKYGVWASHDIEPDSGNSGNPIAGSRSLFESREHFPCSVIISTKSIRHMWSWLEVLTSHLEFSASLQSFVSVEQSGEKKQPLEDLMEMCSNKQTNKQIGTTTTSVCDLWGIYVCHFLNVFVPTRTRV